MDSYGDLSARFYDLDKPVAPELALAWYYSRLAAAHGRVLEPMCGSGRFLLPLVQRGLRVDGADPAKAMLDACAEKLRQAGLAAGLFPQALEQLDLEFRGYAAAFIPASSIGLLPPDAARAGLARLHDHLAPGALILLEFEPPGEFGDGPQVSARTVGKGGTQIRLESTITYDPAARVETHRNRYQLKQSGRVTQTEDEVLTLHCYDTAAMGALLESAGFEVIAIEHRGFGWVAEGRKPAS